MLSFQVIINLFDTFDHLLTSRKKNYCFTPTEFLTALFLKKSIERKDCNKFIKILQIYLLELSTL